MRCPFCTSMETKVIDSRASKEGYVIRRRRSCDGCKSRFTTYEKIEALLPLVVKKDQRREAFDRQKIVRGLQQACQKRSVSAETIEDITDRIERVYMDCNEKEVPSREIGEQLMEELRQLDQVAYVRFASVYREFRDAEQFMMEVKGLMAQQEGASERQ